ncbi:MAG: hypothetical protein V4607_08220 [Pseudomonadota bacterium]
MSNTSAIKTIRKGQRTTRLVVLLALLSAGSIAGMLLSDGLWDVIFFLLATLPLIFGAWQAYALRTTSIKKPARKLEK